MASHTAAAGRPSTHPDALGAVHERAVERVARPDEEAVMRAPDWDRGLMRQMHTMSIVSIDKMPAPPRKAEHVVGTKVIFTSCPTPGNEGSVATWLSIPANATQAAASVAIIRLRSHILRHIQDCSANAPHSGWGGVDADATFRAIFPAGKDAFNFGWLLRPAAVD